MHACVHVGVRVHACMLACVHACVHVGVRVHACMLACVHACVRACACMHACVRVHVCACVYLLIVLCLLTDFQRVDIYSVGIIFFEMCLPPPSTSMERQKLLTDIRKKEIAFPLTFDLEKNQKQVC